MTTPEEIIDTLSFFDSWEDRYKYMIDLGKSLPELPAELRTDEKLVPGCQSQVWINPVFNNEKFEFQVDSDAHIVRGLLAIVMAAYNHKTPQQIIEFDIQSYFDQLDLVKHLSPTRGNGLKAMVEKIIQMAKDKT
ncbi:SufE family protein [Aliikangiella sp. IMCC44359]|uniref:SufE family protein n=1 Tax=Aliikangiella sp. IMCC44359 TaxID=3459125 RepID=UPI00403AFC2D